MTAIQHNPPANSRTPSARELVAAKNAQAPIQQAASTAMVPATPAAPDNRPYRERYLSEVSQDAMAGRMVKFDGKEGVFKTHDDGQPIPETAEFIVLADQTLVGWVKFNGSGEPPNRVMGALYDDFIMPARESLGDTDITKWELGIDRQPADPWQHHQYLVLQQADTAELFTFVTSSKTGRRAVGNLLKHPDELPVIRLRTGGFQHKDDRVGFVKTPVSVVCGRSPADSAARPDTSTGAYLSDEIPFAPEWRG
jgi:hypothetical protein